MENRPPVVPTSSGQTQMHIQKQGKGVNIDIKIGNKVAQQHSSGRLTPIGVQHFQTKSVPMGRGVNVEVIKTGGVGVNRSGIPGLQATPPQGFVNDGSYVNIGHQNNIGNVQSTPPILFSGNKVGTAGQKGSNFSSPRSSIGGESKGSSPRNTIVNAQPPPPPYDHARHSANSIPNMTSPRSSLSPADSKHSSPRTSITSFNNLVYERFPTPRHSVVTTHHIPVNVPGQNLSHHGGQMYIDRYGDTALPPPYDASKMRAHLAMQINQPQSMHLSSVIPQGVPISGNNVTIQNLPRVQATVTSNPPETMAYNFVPTSQVGNTLSPGQNAIPNQNLTKLKGLNYDIVPPKQDGPSEAEKKLAALTQQLEQDMRLSSPAGNGTAGRKISNASSTDIKIEPPPPYPGLHHTVPVSLQLSNTSVPPSTSLHLQMSPKSNMSSPTSTKSSITTTPIKTSLPMQVTPAQPTGPTDVEKKLDVLTQELESQMDKQPQGDYYGK